MQPNSNVIATMRNMELDREIEDLEWCRLFELWFFNFRDMRFGIDSDGIITLFSIEW